MYFNETKKCHYEKLKRNFPFTIKQLSEQEASENRNDFKMKDWINNPLYKVCRNQLQTKHEPL